MCELSAFSLEPKVPAGPLTDQHAERPAILVEHFELPTHRQELLLEPTKSGVRIVEHVNVIKLIHLVCQSEEQMMHRMRRRAIRENRADDANESVIRHRFEVYRQETYPVLDFYPQEMVSEIDAMGSPAEVLRKILEVLVPVQNEHFAKMGADVL